MHAAMRALAVAVVAGMVAAATAASGLPSQPRFQHTMEIFDGKMCVFGGKHNSTGVMLADFQLDYRCVDVTKSIQRSKPKWRHPGSSSRFVMPPLAQQTSVYDPVNHIIVPYGGQVPTGFSQANNLAVYCTLYQAWGASNIVDADPRRYVHTAVLQQRSGDMIIFGGARDSTTRGDGNRYNNPSRMVLDMVRHTENNRRLGLATPANLTVGDVVQDNAGAIPSVLIGIIHHASELIGDRDMVVMGGNSPDPQNNSVAYQLPLSTVYVYDVDAFTWSARNCTGDVPTPRSVSASAQRDGLIYLHGGVNVSGWSQFFDELHVLNTTSWTWRRLPVDRASPHTPRARYAHKMKLVGDFLVITHGYIYTDAAPGAMGGDPDIYFYDLKRQAFVDRYSPRGATQRELDTGWTVRRKSSATGIAALCFLLAMAVAVVAAYYLYEELENLLAMRARRDHHHHHHRRVQPGRGGLQSMVESFAGSLRQSNLLFGDARASGDRRASQETEGGLGALGGGRKSFSVQRAKALGGGGAVLLEDDQHHRRLSLSEGATTVIASEPSAVARQQQLQQLQLGDYYGEEGPRHARVLDAADGSSHHLARRLTISERIPRSDPRPTVRFSECSGSDVAVPAVAAAAAGYGYNGDDAASERSDSIDLAALEEPAECDAATDASIDDVVSPLRIMNPDDDNDSR
ncbi:hypothetical protein H4R18_003268 [Coemansia javaensis]|uniref:Galactose oxidase n=1 Tax=Coemansia javaensis TaxID=2761396 RepID=A0A9W8H7F8_9FUNG|nr:hypothetical protein H4R18_003268 [Coemansia javaensis]